VLFVPITRTLVTFAVLIRSPSPVVFTTVVVFVVFCASILPVATGWSRVSLCRSTDSPS